VPQNLRNVAQHADDNVMIWKRNDFGKFRLETVFSNFFQVFCTKQTLLVVLCESSCMTATECELVDYRTSLSTAHSLGVGREASLAAQTTPSPSGHPLVFIEPEVIIIIISMGESCARIDEGGVLREPHFQCSHLGRIFSSLTTCVSLIVPVDSKARTHVRRRREAV